MRLIDADAIVYTHEVARSLDDRHNWIELCVTQDDIECMPTIDAVEVVRCKDCKWHMDKFCNNFNVIGFDNDDFCSMGERKSDAQS